MAFNVGTAVGSYFGTAATAQSIAVVSPASNADIVIWAQYGSSGSAPGCTVDGFAATQVGSSVNSSSETLLQYVYQGAASGSHTVAFSLGTAANIGLAAVAVGGAGATDGGNTVDSNFAGTGTNAVLSFNVTTAHNGDIVFGFANWVSGSGTIASGTGYTNCSGASSGTFSSCCMEYIVQGTAGAIQPTFTASNNSDILCGTIALQAAAGGGGGSQGGFRTRQRWRV